VWTESDTEDLNNATLSLAPGQYRYNAYEVTAPNTYNLVETGRAIVIGEDPDNVYFETDDATDNVVYE
jgi:hypothetical protein